MDLPFILGDLVYLTNRLARGSPDKTFTNHNGVGLIVDIIEREGGFKPQYRVKWLKSDEEMVFHADALVYVNEVEREARS